MKALFITFFLLINLLANAQVPESEQWRYVSLSTSLFCFSDNGRQRYLNDDGSEKTTMELQQWQIDLSDVFKDTIAKHITIKLTDRNDSIIFGQFFNGTNDTLSIPLYSSRFIAFETQVFYKGHWIPFQINRPAGCVSIGKFRLDPHFGFYLQLEVSTSDGYKLPFRLKMELNGNDYYSNEIEITCNKKQYNLLSKKIADYTF